MTVYVGCFIYGFETWFLTLLMVFDKRRRVEYLDLGNRNNQKDGDNYIKCFVSFSLQ